MVRILLVESLRFQREILKNVLKSHDYFDIIEAENGKEGIERYKEGRPDLTIIALGSSKYHTSNLEVIREIKELNSDAKIIVLGNIRQGEEMEKAKAIGAEACVVIPITEYKLIPKIEEIFSGT